MTFLMKISPTAAVCLLLAWAAVAAAIGSVAPEAYSLAVGTGLMGVFYFGWPYLFARALRSGPGDERAGTLTAAWIGAVMANLVTPILGAGSAGEWPLSFIMTMIGLACVIALMWVASWRLVSREGRAHPAADRCVGTFLLFLFLPFGIVVLQRRIRTVGSRSSPIGVAA